MNVALLYESDAYQVTRANPMGRHFAGFGFLSAYARHSSASNFTGLVRRPELDREFKEFMGRFRPEIPAQCLTLDQIGRLRDVGCFHWPALPPAEQAWIRHRHGPRSWSICGVNHTLSSAGAMDAVTGLLTAPFQPWDALICTSKASQDVIRRLLEGQAEFLRQHLGASRFPVPQMPIIPLGVDCEAQQRQRQARGRARSALSIAEDETVVLFLGRLSYHAKANPAPMYLALEQVAARHKPVLIECGWAANDAIDQGLQEAKAKLCPSVRSITLDGRDPDKRTLAWGSADIFCSLSDNIQETFGLTPIEAMAAGIPVVVSDWDGYKDTVRSGIDGFTVPTIAPGRGCGASLALRHALGIDNYDVYIAQTCAATVVDIDAAAAALTALTEDPELRARMGASGAKRAREVFDWSVIVRAYEHLWGQLAEIRRSGNAEADAPRTWPARPDPFELFASFPTTLLSADDLIARRPGIDDAEVAARIDLKITMTTIFQDLPVKLALAAWRSVSREPQSIGKLLADRPIGQRASFARAFLLLAKIGLTDIRAARDPRNAAGREQAPVERA